MQMLEQAIGYSFRNKALLEQAVCHSSYANEVLKDSMKSYERLEFLGDAILDFVATEYLFENYGQMHEGEMSKLRAELVCEKSLVITSQALKLNEYLKLGKGEELGGGRVRSSILADLVESIIAAIYLDSGFAEAKSFILRFVLSDPGLRVQAAADYKTTLQEWVQRKKDQILEYHLLDETGPEHDKMFYVSVTLNGETVGKGSGTSKKRAEQAAAEQAVRTHFPDALLK